MNQVDSMEKLYRQFSDLAEFRLVYVSEAHPVDGGMGPSSRAKECGISQPTTYEDRVAVATMLQKEKKSTIPTLVDGMDNAVSNAYAAFPCRLIVIGMTGRVEVSTMFGPEDLDAAVEMSEEWLNEFKNADKKKVVEETL